jgi:hypothetical protein
VRRVTWNQKKLDGDRLTFQKLVVSASSSNAIKRSTHGPHAPCSDEALYYESIRDDAVTASPQIGSSTTPPSKEMRRLRKLG